MRKLGRRALDHLSGVEPDRGQVDLAVDLREWGDSEVSIVEAGGRWDRERREWIGEARQRAVWRVQPAQYEAAYWFADWLRAWLAGVRLPGSEDVYNLLLMGGAGGGKTDFIVKAWGILAVAKPSSVTFAVSPVEKDHTELLRYVAAMWPASWYYKPESEDRFYFFNGSQPELLSAYDDETLKRGQTDLALLNEAQKFPKRVYTMLRRRLGDRSGLLAMAANPASKEHGLWINDMHDEVVCGRRPTVRMFHFDWRQNPTIDQRAQETLSIDLDEDDVRRERDGEVIPLGKVVFERWSLEPAPRGNVAPVPELGEDVTEWFLKLVLGRPFKQWIGLDFDKLAYLPAMVGRAFADPEFHADDDPRKKIPVLPWYVDEVVVDEGEGLEDAVIDRLEAKGYRPEETAIIPDATGDIQGIQRIKGKHSLDVWRKREWRNIYFPQKHAKTNPDVSERMKVARALIRDSTGKRRLHSVPENHRFNAAMKKWPILNGGPARQHFFAHMCDAGTYPLYRLFARYLRLARPPKKTIELVTSERSDRRRQFDDVI